MALSGFPHPIEIWWSDFGRRACGLKLRELAAAVKKSDFSAVSIAIRRYERLQKRGPARRALLKEVYNLLSVEM